MCMHLSINVYVCVFDWAFVQAELSPGLQALPWGRRSSWTDGVTGSAQNHSPGSETEKEAQTEVSELKEVSGSQRNIQTKTPEKNELLPDHWSRRPADCDGLTGSESKMAMRSLRHTEPTGSLKQDLFFRAHGDPLKNSLPSLYLNPAQG